MLPIFRQAADQSSKWPPGTAYLGPCPGRSLHKPPFQDGAALVRKMTCSEFEFKVRRLRLVWKKAYFPHGHYHNGHLEKYKDCQDRIWMEVFFCTLKIVIFNSQETSSPGCTIQTGKKNRQHSKFLSKKGWSLTLERLLKKSSTDGPSSRYFSFEGVAVILTAYSLVESIIFSDLKCEFIPIGQWDSRNWLECKSGKPTDLGKDWISMPPRGVSQCGCAAFVRECPPRSPK